ncbi:MAG: sensor histidine kinase [Anaeromyxobacter sp.]|nr:sensor histidine kinase [Anaeromyxobacter sp.]MBL0277604.1 sensor histidine kinase [Anaeromyxobacter sp.]
MSDTTDQVLNGEEEPSGPASDRERHLGFVAHEVRNPLSTALWTAELLTRIPSAERGGARGEKLAAICLRSVGKVRTLLEDHLLAERLDTGEYPLRPERLLLVEVLAAALERLPAGHPPVQQEVPPGLAIQADRLLLQRALEGLVAVAGAEVPEVRLVARLAGGRAEVLVSGAPVRALHDPRKGDPSDQQGRALSLPAIRRIAAALGGGLQAGPQGYLLSIPAA